METKKKKLVPFRGDVTSGYLPSNSRRRSEGKARSRENENGGAAQGSNSSVSTLRIRFLPLVVFSVLSCTFSEHDRKKSVDQRPPKSKAEFRTPIDRSLVRERRVKKDKMLVEKIQIEFVSKGSRTPDAVGEETKKQGS